MSRTDVHAPGWVKERDPLWRANHREHHNHHQYVIGHEKVKTEDGHTKYKPIWKKVERCDLDDYLALRGWSYTRTACSIQFWSNGRNVHCGCNLCTNFIGRRHDRRVGRQKAKRDLRAGRWDEGLYRGRY